MGTSFLSFGHTTWSLHKARRLMLSNHFEGFSYFSFWQISVIRIPGGLSRRILKNDQTFYFCSLMTGADMPRFFQRLTEPVASTMSSKHQISTRLLVAVWFFVMHTWVHHRALLVVAQYLPEDIFGKRELVQYCEVLSMTVRSQVFHRFFESTATASATPIRSGVPVLRQIHHSQKMKALAKTAVG